MSNTIFYPLCGAASSVQSMHFSSTARGDTEANASQSGRKESNAGTQKEKDARIGRVLDEALPEELVSALDQHSTCRNILPHL